MKSKLTAVLAIALWVFYTPVSAQYIFQKTYTEEGRMQLYGRSGIQTSDNGFLVSGFHHSIPSTGETDAFLLKLDEQGETEWFQRYGYASSSEHAERVIQDADGNFVFIGEDNYHQGDGWDVSITKTDPLGSVIWKSNIAGPDHERGNSIVQTPEGDYVVCGSTSSFGSDKDFFVAKLDINGNILWRRAMDIDENETLYSVQLLSNGDIVVVGGSDNNSLNDQNLVVFKLSTSGNVLWNRTFDISGRFIAFDVVVAQNDDILVTGVMQYSISGTGSRDAFLLKIRPSGTIVGVKRYSHSSDIEIYSMDLTHDGGIVLYGTERNASSQNYILIKTTGNGIIESSRIYGLDGLSTAGQITQTSDLGYAMFGRTNAFGSTDPKVYMVKTDSTGFSGCQESKISLITMPFSDYTLRTGYNSYSFSSGTFVPSSKIDDIVTDSTLCEEGSICDSVALRWAYSVIGPCKRNFQSSVTVPSGYIVVGYHWDFGDGTTSTGINPTHQYTENGLYSVCLKVTVEVNGIVCTKEFCQNIKVICKKPDGDPLPNVIFNKKDLSPWNEGRFIVYPNPSSGSFSVELPKETTPFNVLVYNSMGLVVYRAVHADGSTLQVDLSTEARGIYYVQLSNEKSSFHFSQKIILE